MPEMIGRVGLGVVEVVAAMPRCRDCKWWSPEDYHDDRRPEGWGECGLATTKSGYREQPQALMMACDPDEYEAGLLTAPDFGCVQFESRD